jgi:hypothetical protein
MQWKHGMAAICLLGMINANAASSAVERFKQSWTGQTLALQRDIDLDTPLNRATFLGTHNSENSVYYEIPLIRYIDPNQILSIPDQLEMGMRSLEFDVHWYLSTNFQKDILLSHALENHVGCSSFDRRVTEGLQELQDWLKANPHEVVILYFDRGTALDGHEPRLAAYLEQYLGNFIYHASAARDPNDKTTSCVSIPTTISKADVLKAGKQLLVVTKRCDGTNPQYEELDKFPLAWNDVVFAGIGNVKNHENDIMDSTIGDDFTPYPQCSKTTVFADDPEHTTLWRIFEDTTIIGKIVPPPPRYIVAADVTTMTNCGINWPTFDKLTANDNRLEAAIWSWALGFPKSGAGNCAVYKNASGIINIPCTTTNPAFACREETTHEIKAVAASGEWNDGEKSCQLNAGTGWHFAMPVNGNEMYLLKQSANAEELSFVWLNYQLNSENQWRANNWITRKS